MPFSKSNYLLLNKNKYISYPTKWLWSKMRFSLSFLSSNPIQFELTFEAYFVYDVFIVCVVVVVVVLIPEKSPYREIKIKWPDLVRKPSTSNFTQLRNWCKTTLNVTYRRPFIINLIDWSTVNEYISFWMYISRPLFLYFLLSIQLAGNKRPIQNLLMTRFEQPTSCVGSNRSTNWATITAKKIIFLIRGHGRSPFRSISAFFKEPFGHKFELKCVPLPSCMSHNKIVIIE